MLRIEVKNGNIEKALSLFKRKTIQEGSKQDAQKGSKCVNHGYF